MSTSTIENPTPSLAVAEKAGAHVEVAGERTIALTEEFRCTRPTTVGKGIDDVRRCGAEAWVHVVYSAEADLSRYLCAHHATAEWDTLVATAESIRDERGLINKKPGGSAAG